MKKKKISVCKKYTKKIKKQKTASPHNLASLMSFQGLLQPNLK